MTVKESLPVTSKKYELVPPDGGWGYVICVAVTLNFISMTAFMSSFGIIYNDFFKELGMGSTDVNLLVGINAMSNAVAGFLAGPLLKIMSMRKLAFIASTSFNAGVLGTVFVKTQTQLILCQGLLQGSGMGLLFNLSCTALNDYFKKKRLLSLSVVNTVTAAAAIIAPVVVDWSTVKFKFEGTLYLISGVASLTFAGSALMQPVAWHLRKVEIEDDVPEIKLLLENSNKEKQDEALLKTPVLMLTNPEKIPDLFSEEKDNLSDKGSKGNVMLDFIKSYLDWPLLKEYLLTCTCVGIPICMFTDNTYTFFLPQYLYEQNWSNNSVARAFSLQAFGDIATRIVLIFSNSIFKILGSRLVYVIGIVVGIVTKLALLWVTDRMAMLVIITVMGISRCTITVLFPLVVSDSVKSESFPSAMGISLMMYGLASLIMGPITGAIRDATGDYSTMFYILISFLAAVAVAMSVEVVLKKRKQEIPEIKNKFNKFKNYDFENKD